jgi:hypothetical protein
MEFENSINNSEYNPHHFEAIAARKAPKLQEFMSYYLSQNFLDERGVFEADEPRIDTVGEQLARTLIDTEPTDKDIAAMQRCVRFGLRLSMELSYYRPGYMAGLGSLEVVLRKGYAEKLIQSSYDRYLSGQQSIRDILMGNLRPLTAGANPAAQIVGQNVISFVVEEADRETYVAQSAQNVFNQVSEILRHPPEL